MNITLDPADLRPLIEAIVAEVLATAPTLDGDRLAYPEAEAAAKIGCRPHQLRDARLRGDITPTKCCGRIGYERSELLAYLARNRGAAT